MPSPGNTRPPGSTAPSLSLCMIVRNERADLEHCLRSVRGLADEMVIVDTGSTDGTQELARREGARLIQATWENDFSRARNLALAQATGRWILVLDADESLQESDREPLRQLLAQHTPATGAPAIAFNLIQKSTADGGRTGMTAYIVRIFPNRPDVRYAGPVHEQVSPSLSRAGIPVENTAIVILHTGYIDLARNRAKQVRNGQILRTQIAAGNEVTPLTYFLLAGCQLDLDDPSSALGNYTECLRLARQTPGQEEIGRGAVVRIVDCLVRLGRFAEALGYMPTEPESSWHPELFIARGVIEQSLGRPEEARRWFERIFACVDRPRIPACHLAGRKVEALKHLGDHWYNQGRPALGIALLRAGVALREEGRDFTTEDLTAAMQSQP